jgi:hypothetical protein
VNSRTLQKIVVAATLLFCSNAKALSQGKKALYAGTGSYKEIGFANSYLTTVDVGVTFQLSRWFVVSPEVDMYKFWNSDYSPLGVGFRPALKAYFLNDANWSIFAEMKGGIIYMFPEFENSAVNFTLIQSMGTEIAVSHNKRISLAIGYCHFSNGRRNDNAKNPMWDGVGASVGLIHRIK